MAFLPGARAGLAAAGGGALKERLVDAAATSAAERQQMLANVSDRIRSACPWLQVLRVGMNSESASCPSRTRSQLLKCVPAIVFLQAMDETQILGVYVIELSYEQTCYRLWLDVYATVAAFSTRVYLATGVIPQRQNIVGFQVTFKEFMMKISAHRIFYSLVLAMKFPCLLMLIFANWRSMME